MANTGTPNEESADLSGAAAAFIRADLACTFGPSFFLRQLARFVRDHCPTPEEHLPMVQVRLADGEVLDVCHIIGVSPRWVILAVRNAAGHQGMVIEIVPFELVRRISISARRADGASIGFAQTHVPNIMTAEALLHAATAVAEAEA